jgi:hypothetical protein
MYDCACRGNQCWCEAKLPFVKIIYISSYFVYKYESFLTVALFSISIDKSDVSACGFTKIQSNCKQSIEENIVRFLMDM